jgi:hypothetical protein
MANLSALVFRAAVEMTGALIVLMSGIRRIQSVPPLFSQLMTNLDSYAWADLRAWLPIRKYASGSTQIQQMPTVSERY